MKINQLTQTDTVLDDDLFLIDSTTNGTQSIDAKTLGTIFKEFPESDNGKEANVLLHRNIFRGKYLGDEVNDEQWKSISNGTFNDIWLGDYWTINDVNWRVADINLFNPGSNGTNTSGLKEDHLVIVPDSCLVHPCVYNATSTVTGGYYGSVLRTSHIQTALNNKIHPSFGIEHVWPVKLSISNTVSDGCVSGTALVEDSAYALDSVFVFGDLFPDNTVRNSILDKNIYKAVRRQFSLFKHGPTKYIYTTQSYWLQDIWGAGSAMAVRNYQTTEAVSTNGADIGLRPFFCIGGANDEFHTQG